MPGHTAPKNNLSLQAVREALHYEPLTGLFTRLSGGPKRNRTGQVGTLKDGYVKIGIWHKDIGHKQYYAHRLAWLLMTGEWPVAVIDHINRNRADNRFCNLRQASLAQNQWNRGLPRTSTVGLKGVFFIKTSGKWKASISVSHKTVYLGHFDTAEEAHAAYMRAAAMKFGAFARSA